MEQINTTASEIMSSHITNCKASGINVRAYCMKHNIKPSTYYYWLSKGRKSVSTGKFISIPLPLTQVPVYISFTNGTRVCFENMPPADYVKKILS